MNFILVPKDQEKKKVGSTGAGRRQRSMFIFVSSFVQRPVDNGQRRTEQEDPRPGL